jgi:MFS family permease
VRKWLPLIILAAAQFVMVLDSAVMNVSISQIVADLDTTISGVQLAITMYTLVMAAFMLVGAKLGDIHGRDTIFAVGLAVYGLGSLITSLSPNLAVLLFGWSLVEGLGAVMVIPAIAALIAVNYEGKERAFAYSMIGGVSGAAIAAGPLIGGFVTTYFSWRYVFAGETVVVIGILLFRRQMKRAPKVEKPPQLDVVGAALSAAGLGLAVYGILKSSDWGWIQPRGALTINGNEITPFGLSVVPFLILGGLVLLGCFWMWLEHRDAQGRDALLDRALLKIVHLRAGLSTLLMQQLILLGVFFVLPVYLQVVLGLDAFETGKRLFPMSVSMLAAALLGPRVAARRSPKRTAQLGLGALVIGSFVLLGTIDVTLHGWQFGFGLALFGIGAGLLVSQLGNVIISSVPPDRTNEAGGLQGTAQNLGASLGTALIGAVLLTGLTNGFVERVEDNPALPQSTEAALTDAASKGLDAVPVEQVEEAALDAGLPPAQATEVADAYGEAELDGLRNALFAVAAFGVLAFWPARRLPGTAAEPAAVAETSPAPAPAA